MATISQRELSNNVDDLLRRAEGGERFVITVDGRPVAEIGPTEHSRRFASPAALERILRETPVDAQWADDLRRMRDEETT